VKVSPGKIVPPLLERVLFIVFIACFPPKNVNGKPIVIKQSIFLLFRLPADLRNVEITGEALKAHTGPPKMIVSKLSSEGGSDMVMSFDPG
jgi:hypothetical protein